MTHTYWYLARSSGIVAWGLLAAATLWGLLLSTRVFGRRPSPKWLTDLHRFLGGTACVFTGVHVAMLVADSYVHFGAVDLLVPFASAWHPAAVAWGVISMWLLAAVELTSLAMRWMPRRLWHRVHLSSYVLFFTSTLHGLTAGTDARSPVFALACDATLSVALLLTLVRVLSPRPQPGRSARAAPAAGG